MYKKAVLIIGLSLTSCSTEENVQSFIPTSHPLISDLIIEVKCVGELEASHSHVIASSVKGDLGKIIYLIQDGANVNAGDLLIKMDSSPFEQKIIEIEAAVREQQGKIEELVKALEWEHYQAEYDEKAILFEIESAELELKKIVDGDGPLESGKLKAAMQKAQAKYEEIAGYSQDLEMLLNEGYLNPNELKQAQKLMAEEKENYETAKQQYDSFQNHVHPLQVRKAETMLNNLKSKRDEVVQNAAYKIARAEAWITQGRQELNNQNALLEEAKKELERSEIKAPTAGMAVHREEYRSGQKRRPRVGDILVRNQPLLDLPDLTSLIVRTKVREVDLHKVSVGTPAQIKIEAYPERVFVGKVLSLGILAVADIGATGDDKYFEMKIGLEDVSSDLRPGMTARVNVHAASKQNVLAIPLQAIFEEQDKAFCFVKKGEKYSKNKVALGMSTDQSIEVLEGLTEEDEVALVHPGLKDIND